MKTQILLAPALAAILALGLQIPSAAQADNMLPASQRTITYDAGLEGTSVRPIVGAVLAGTMRLTLYPDGTIQGTYIPEDGNSFQVAGGMQQDGTVFLTLGRTTVNGKLMGNGTIVGTTFGPAAFNALKFVAVPNSPGHRRQQS